MINFPQRTEGEVLHLDKSITKKPTADIIVNGERLRIFTLKSGTRQGSLSTLTTLI